MNKLVLASSVIALVSQPAFAKPSAASPTETVYAPKSFSDHNPICSGISYWGPDYSGWGQSDAAFDVLLDQYNAAHVGHGASSSQAADLNTVWCGG